MIYPQKSQLEAYDSNGNLITIPASPTDGLKVSLGGAALDAFGRQRVSDPLTLFDSKQLYDNQPLFWDDQEVSGSGTTSVHNPNEASSVLSVSATTAGKRVRQTFRRFNYQSGKSQLIMMTGILSSGGTGITEEIGYFDDNNGLFFQSKDGVKSVVRRTNVTGSPVDTTINQSSWNLDKMNGTGSSGVNIDFDKTQIFIIDFEWLGVGRVRMGFVHNGEIIYCHEILNSNNLEEVYMSTPNLPIRYSIENDGTGGADSITQICATVISEGGKQNTGVVRSFDLGTATINANTVDTEYALIGIRHKAANLGATLTEDSSSILATTADAFRWTLSIGSTVAGTFNYNDVSNSSIQVAYGDTAGNPSTNTVTLGTVIDSGYVSQQSRSVNLNLSSVLKIGSFIDGTRQELLLSVTPLTGNLDITGSLSIRELS